MARQACLLLGWALALLICSPLAAARPTRELKQHDPSAAAHAAAVAAAGKAARQAHPLWASAAEVTHDAYARPVTADGVTEPPEPPRGAPPAPLAPRPPRRGRVGGPRVAAVTRKYVEEAALRDNPMLDEAAQFPRYDVITPAHVAPAMRALIGNLSADLDALEARLARGGGARSYADVMHPLERITDRLARVWGVVTHLKNVRDSAELRAAVNEANPGVLGFQLRLGQSRAIYDALKALKGGPGWRDLNSVQQRAVELQLRDLELGGVGLSGRERARYNELRHKIALLSGQYNANVRTSTDAFRKLITNASDVEGMLEEDLARAAQAARDDGYGNATTQDGPWVLGLDALAYVGVVTYANNRTLREEVYRAYLNRAGTNTTDNTPVIEDLLAARRESARLLGFENHAQLSMATKMATFDGAWHLLEDLRAAARESGARDHEELTAFAQASGHQGPLEWWDLPYYSQKLQAAKYNVSDDELKPYLSFPAVLDGLFKLTKRLFGVDVVPADGLAPVWHPDVRFFELRAPAANWDSANPNSDGDSQANGTTVPIAYLYIDPYSRPAEKRSGAWMDSIIARSALFAPPGAAARLPVAVAVTNQAPPMGDAPSLMTPSAVKTLFHEFGHTLQHTLTRVDEGLVSGIRGIPWDAIELASQFMENWVYERETLASFARHYKTGEPLPAEAYDRLIASKNHRAGWALLRQVQLAEKDLMLHSEYIPGRGGSIYDIERKVFTVPLAPLPDDHSLCSFSHIFTRGYSAAYYSYRWSEVLSADAFAAFEEAGLNDPAALRAVGRRYAATVLALGGGAHPAKVYESFRGRDPSTKALLRHAGLAA